MAIEYDMIPKFASLKADEPYPYPRNSWTKPTILSVDGGTRRVLIAWYELVKRDDANE